MENDTFADAMHEVNPSIDRKAHELVWMEEELSHLQTRRWRCSCGLLCEMSGPYERQAEMKYYLARVAYSHTGEKVYER
jgi:hypothetical protein